MLAPSAFDWLQSLPLVLVAYQVLRWGYDLWAAACWKPTAVITHSAKRLPFLGDTLEMLTNVHRYHDWHLEMSERAHGQPYEFKTLGRPRVLFFSSPEIFEDVFKKHFDAFDKGPLLAENVRDLLGEGIFAVDGAKWVRQRKATMALFNSRALREGMTKSVHALVPTMHSILDNAAQTNELVDLGRLFHRFILEVFAEIGFGLKMNGLSDAQEHPFEHAFDSSQRILFQRFVRPWWFWRLQQWLDVGLEHEMKQNVQVLDEMVCNIISEALQRRASESQEPVAAGKKTDIISLFLDSKHNEDVDVKMLRDIVINFLIAGRDTTAQALTWFFTEIMQNPRVEREIRDEIMRKLPQVASGEVTTPTMEQTQELHYLEAALKESLRLHPALPSNQKMANRDVELSDGTLIKQGETVGVSTYTLGRMESVWGKDAKEYKPERWIDPNTGKLTPVSPYKFAAFNAGPRVCVGMNLALMEMKTVAVSLIARFHCEMLPGQDLSYDMSTSLPQKSPIMARIVLVSR